MLLAKRALARSRSTLVRFAPWQMAACCFACRGEAALCSKVLNLIFSLWVIELICMQEDGQDSYRLPYYIRASFLMEERWGDLSCCRLISLGMFMILLTTQSPHAGGWL